MKILTGLSRTNKKIITKKGEVKMLNTTIITGRFTKEPTLQISKSANNDEIKFINFTLAVQRNYKNPEGTYSADFIDCVAWRSTAEFIQKHFSKGQEITLRGELRTNSYTDKNDVKRKSTVLKVEQAFFASAKKTNEVSAFSENVSEDIPLPGDDMAPPLSDYMEYDVESEL